MLPMKYKFKILTLILVALAAGSCKKFRMEANVPECIEKRAKDETKDSRSVYASILEYEFQSMIVYVFDLQAGDADAQAHIYKSDCVYLGYLGGIEGNRMINGEDFGSAVFKRKVWPLKN